MFINQSMTRKVVTIEKEASILKAEELMKTHQIRHLPVVEDGQKLVDIMSATANCPIFSLASLASGLSGLWKNS